MDQRTTQRFCSPTGKMVTIISGRLGAWKPETGEHSIRHVLSQGFKLRGASTPGWHVNRRPTPRFALGHLWRYPYSAAVTSSLRTSHVQPACLAQPLTEPVPRRTQPAVTSQLRSPFSAVNAADQRHTEKRHC